MSVLLTYNSGDIWEAGKVILRSGRVVIDADKAPGEYQRESDSSNALEGALDHLHATLTSTRPNPYTSDTTDLVNDIKTRTKKRIQKLDRRYGNKLGKNAPRGRGHGVVKKIRYALSAPKDEEKYQKEQQVPLNALQTRTLGVVVGNQEVQLSTVEQAIAQGEAHHNSLVQTVSQIQSTVLQRLDVTDSSRQQQQTSLASCLDNGINVILARLQDQPRELAAELRKIMSEEGLRISMYGSGRILDGLPSGGGTPPPRTGAMPSTDGRENAGTQPHCQDQPSRSPRSTNEIRKLEAISVLKVRNRSMEFTWWNQGQASRTILPNVSLAGGDEGFLSVLLTFFFILLGVPLELGLGLGRYVSSQVTRPASIPSSISFMMTGSIRFTDALGRSHKLSVVQSTKWELLDGWLRVQFEGCPGSAKVQDGKYVIFDAQNPSHILTKATWEQAVRHRRRFQMAIAYEHVQLSHSCPRCGKPWSAGKDLHGFVKCPSCEQGYSSSVTGSLRSVLKRHMDLFAKPDQWWEMDAPRQLMVEASVNGFKHAAAAFKKLTNQLGEGNDIDNDDIDLEEDILSPLIRPVSQASEPAPFPAEYSHWAAGEHRRDIEDAWLDDDTADAIGMPSCGPAREMSDQERHERGELAHFSTVWMQKDDRLHNAALSGNYDATADLIRGGVDVNETTGRLGSALVAAIASGSTRVVELLLTSGADPLQIVHQGHTPVSVAVCFAGKYVADLILEAAFRASQKHPVRFQDAVDAALYESTRLKRYERHRPLLFMGANPASTVRGDKSSIGLALESNDSINLEKFLTMLYDRSLLTDIEARMIFATSRGMDTELHHVQAWLKVCCAVIAAGSSEPLEREVARRVRKRGGLYFRLNIDNLRCHPDIRTFWTSYENERLGIVRDPLLAGMA